MSTRSVRIALAALASSTLLLSASSAQAVHFYRGTGGGCSAADGALSGDPAGAEPRVAASVVVGHNTFRTGISGLSAEGPSETRIRAGEAITWTWNSAHCHSVTSSATNPDYSPTWNSGFHYPTTAPEGPQVAPGVFDYPLLDETPTLSYTRTFTAPGVYAYFCVHHASIGMRGVVVVEAA
jgi:plastocyanin